VRIAAAKNDPRKKGRELYVPRLPAGSQSATLCAVAALERWLELVGSEGPVFRTFDLRGQLTSARLDPGDVARILRRRATAAGVEGDFAGHSLRRGFITNAAKKKIPIESIKRVTGQRSSGIVLDYGPRQPSTRIRRSWKSSAEPAGFGRPLGALGYCSGEDHHRIDWRSR